MSYFGSGDSWFAAADGARKNGSGLVVSRQYLRDASMGHTQLTRYVTGSLQK